MQKIKKVWISTVLWHLITLLSLKNDVTVLTENKKPKNWRKKKLVDCWHLWKNQSVPAPVVFVTLQLSLNCTFFLAGNVPVFISFRRFCATEEGIMKPQIFLCWFDEFCTHLGHIIPVNCLVHQLTYPVTVLPQGRRILHLWYINETAIHR